MARRQNSSTSDKTDSNVVNNASQRRRPNIDLVRIDNRPFESPRGRGRNNPGWGRIDNLPFVSPRGRGRRIPLERRSQHPDTYGNLTYAYASHTDDEPPERQLQQFTASDGTLYSSGLIRLDNKPFESPRGRGRQRGHLIQLVHSHTPSFAPSAPTYGSHTPSLAPSAPTFDSHTPSLAPSSPTKEDIMDVDN